MPKAEQLSTQHPSNGLQGVAEAFADTARRFQEYEDRYRISQVAFGQIQQQFQQMQQTAAQTQTAGEERLAALNALNVELKVRHSQGEQVLGEVRALLEAVKERQQNWAQNADAEQMAAAARAAGAMETLAKQIEERQTSLEQALQAVEGMQQEQGKRYVEQQEVLSEVRNLAYQVADRQAQADKAFSIFNATHEAERGLLAHFEKSLDAVRSMTAETQKRQAQMELALGSVKTGGDAGTVNEKALAPLRALIEQVQQAVASAAQESATKCAQAIEAAQAAQQVATQALEKAGEAPLVAPIADPTPEDRQKANVTFQQFMARCQADHKSALEMESRLQTQVRGTIESLPSRTEGVVQKFLEQSKARIEQIVSGWLQHREQRMLDLESRHDQLVVKALEAHQMLEQELAKRNEAAQDPQQQPAVVSAWIEALEAASSAHTSELRFVKTLLWIALAAVGLGYALVLVAYSSLKP